VTPNPKLGKDHSNLSNYRPNSLLSSISKVFERIILKRLNGFISTVIILPDHQFGFKVAHSTFHQLRRVVRHVKVKRSLRVPESTGMVLLDVEKAFESVWHEALLNKLLVNGCDIFLARLIYSFLKNRSFQVDQIPSLTIFLTVCYKVPFYLLKKIYISRTNYPTAVKFIHVSFEGWY
jgi:hypothetical protein